MTPAARKMMEQMPADRAILFYLADRLRWARAQYRRMSAKCSPESILPELYTCFEAKNAYYGAKDIYYIKKNREKHDKQTA